MEGKVREKMWESKIRNWYELAKRVFGCSIKDTGIAKFSVKIVKRERERERERERLLKSKWVKDRESESEDWALALFNVYWEATGRAGFEQSFTGYVWFWILFLSFNFCSII